MQGKELEEAENASQRRGNLSRVLNAEEEFGRQKKKRGKVV